MQQVSSSDIGQLKRTEDSIFQRNAVDEHSNRKIIDETTGPSCFTSTFREALEFAP